MTLERWGRVEGTILLSGDPRRAAKLVLIAGRAYEAPGLTKNVWLREGANIRYEVDALSNAEGRFAFAMVPPGASWIRRAEGYPILGSDIPVDVKAGETANAIAGEPRTVIGRLVPPAGIELPKDPKAIEIGIELRAPRMLFANDENERRLLEEYKEFLASDEGKAYRQGDVKASPDGTFRVKLPPADKYVLRARVFQDPPEEGGATRVAIAELAGLISVRPAPSGRETEPVDLGRLPLAPILGSGRRAPAFEVKTLDGETFRLADCRGKVVFIDFWATWCGPCRVEIPHLKAVFDAFGKDPRFVMIGLSLDQTIDPVKSYIATAGIGWKQAVIPTNEENSVAAAYAVRAIPSTFLIGPRGEIIAMGLRGAAIRPAIEKALTSEPPKVP